MVSAANLGYPRIGAKRELKRALESYWSGKSSETDLIETGKQLRLAHWQIQQDAGIGIIPSNDFSFYDQMLDATLMVGATSARYAMLDQVNHLQTYFAMARGIQHDGFDIPAMEMTKWFDTNYHYIVPEIEQGQAFRLNSTKVVEEYREAKAAGIETRPVLIGPVTYLLLSKSVSNYVPLDAIGMTPAPRSPLAELPALLTVYGDVLRLLAEAGATWVQIDEPCLVLDLDDTARAAYREAYAQLSAAANINIILATYFGALDDNLSLALGLPVAGLHIGLEPVMNSADELLNCGHEQKSLPQ